MCGAINENVKSKTYL